MCDVGDFSDGGVAAEAQLAKDRAVQAQMVESMLTLAQTIKQQSIHTSRVVREDIDVRGMRAFTHGGRDAMQQVLAQTAAEAESVDRSLEEANAKLKEQVAAALHCASHISLGNRLRHLAAGASSSSYF